MPIHQKNTGRQKGVSTATNECNQQDETEFNRQMATLCTTPEDTALTAVARIKMPWTKPPLSLNAARGTSQGAVFQHAKMVRDMQEQVRWLAKAAKLPQHQVYCVVQMHYMPGDNRRRDTDNLVATLKPVCDALVTYGLVSDDCPRFMAKPEPIIHTRTKHSSRGIWLEIFCYSESKYRW